MSRKPHRRTAADDDRPPPAPRRRRCRPRRKRMPRRGMPPAPRLRAVPAPAVTCAAHTSWRRLRARASAAPPRPLRSAIARSAAATLVGSQSSRRGRTYRRPAASLHPARWPIASSCRTPSASACRVVRRRRRRATPSRTALSTPAGANAAIVTTGDDHFSRAMMYQRLGDFENALVSYRQVLQRDDLNVEAHNNLGVLYRDKGLLDDAIRHFQRAIAINPRLRARAEQSRRRVSRRSGSSTRPRRSFTAALAIDPKNVESMVNLSTVEKESGQRDEARRLARARARDRSAQRRRRTTTSA